MYRCNRVKRSSKQQCEAGVYIIESVKFGDRSDADRGNGDITTSYLLYRKNALHTHRRSPDFVDKVTDRVKSIVLQQYKDGRKPKAISYSILDDDNVPVKEKPKYKQILHIINNYKNNGSGAKPITMRKLTAFEGTD